MAKAAMKTIRLSTGESEFVKSDESQGDAKMPRLCDSVGDV